MVKDKEFKQKGYRKVSVSKIGPEYYFGQTDKDGTTHVIMMGKKQIKELRKFFLDVE